MPPHLPEPEPFKMCHLTLEVPKPHLSEPAEVREALDLSFIVTFSATLTTLFDFYVEVDLSEGRPFVPHHVEWDQYDDPIVRIVLASIFDHEKVSRIIRRVYKALLTYRNYDPPVVKDDHYYKGVGAKLVRDPELAQLASAIRRDTPDDRTPRFIIAVPPELIEAISPPGSEPEAILHRAGYILNLYTSEAVGYPSELHFGDHQHINVVGRNVPDEQITALVELMPSLVAAIDSYIKGEEGES